MSRSVMVKIRMTAAEHEEAAEKARLAGKNVSSWIRSLMFPAAAVTTAGKVPAPKRDLGKLCPACAKGGVAAWNCRVCRPLAKAGVA